MSAILLAYAGRGCAEHHDEEHRGARSSLLEAMQRQLIILSGFSYADGKTRCSIKNLM